MTNVTELKIDPEFQSQIPPLTDDEFEQLRDNILEDGEVYEPIITWNGIIIDGHNRWKIIKDNWEQLKDKYHTKTMSFPDKWAAFDWMYRKQLGRRNLTEGQKQYMTGKMYQARKLSIGGQQGNENAKKRSVQNEHFVFESYDNGKTAKAIGDELGIQMP